MAAPAPVVPIRPAATPSPRPVPRPKPHGRLVSPDQALQTWVRLRDDVVAFHDAGTPLSELEAMTAMSLRDIAEEFTIHATPIPGRISAAVRAHSRNRSAAVPRPA
jgi:hypothetical protein